jgi:hypothetical protein
MLSRPVFTLLRTFVGTERGREIELGTSVLLHDTVPCEQAHHNK